MKTVLVTGGAGGMGSAICRELQNAGCRVFSMDLREAEIPGVSSICCDLTDVKSLETAAEEFKKQCSHLDGIVHAAGIYDLDALSEMDDARFQRIFSVNVFGAYRVNRLFLPFMGAGGRVTVITSELAPLNPLPFTGIYAVTKAALDKYAYSLRSELALRDIRVTVIRPGAVKTGLLGVSTRALEQFCANTKSFAPNAEHFRDIVNRVEAKSVGPEKIGVLAKKAQLGKHPRYVYSINRNFLLRLMSWLPDHFQVWVLKLILK